MYRMTITKFDTNPNYEEELKKYNQRQFQNTYGSYNETVAPLRELNHRVCEVELTEEEYKNVRQSMIEFWAGPF